MTLSRASSRLCQALFIGDFRGNRVVQALMTAATAKQRGRFHFDPRAHRGGDCYSVNVVAPSPRRLRPLHGVGECLDVLDQLFFRERSFADPGLDDTGLLGAELYRPALGALNSG